MASALTPLGQRTKAGFIKKFGKQGAAKFSAAMDKGLIDRGKMENVGLNDDDSGDETSSAGPPPGAGAEMIDSATPPGMAEGGAMTGLPLPPVKPNPTRPGKRRVPMTTARAAGGNFQKRPG